MVTRLLVAAMGCLLIAGCSSSSSLTTGSLFGGGDAKKAAAGAPTVSGAASPVVGSDAVTRAFHVGANSARAIRCGFRFDAAKLKADFMAAETAAGAPVEDIAKAGNSYSVGFNGVSKGIGDAKAYCTPKKVGAVKAALTRYLAGDYTPPKAKKVAKANDGGIFGGFFESDAVGDSGPKFGSDSWWEKQNSASGN